MKNIIQQTMNYIIASFHHTCTFTPTTPPPFLPANTPYYESQPWWYRPDASTPSINKTTPTSPKTPAPLSHAARTPAARPPPPPQEQTYSIWPSAADSTVTAPRQQQRTTDFRGGGLGGGQWHWARAIIVVVVLMGLYWSWWRWVREPGVALWVVPDFGGNVWEVGGGVEGRSLLSLVWGLLWCALRRGRGGLLGRLACGFVCGVMVWFN